MVSKKEYKGKIVRFLETPENGLLIQTKDICAVVELKECPTHEWLDLVEAISIAGKNDATDFAMWLNETFAGYELETLVRPR